MRVRTTITGVAGSPAYTNLHFAGADSTDAVAATASVRAFWEALKGEIHTGAVVIYDPFVAVINPATGQPSGGFTITAPAQTVATSTTNMLPPATNLLIGLRTGVYPKGREVQGRIFIPYLGTGASTPSGTVGATLANTALTAINAMLANGPDLLCYSRVNGVAPPVQSAVVGNKWAVLRSRRD